MKALKLTPGQVGWVEPRKEAGPQPPVMPVEEFRPTPTPQTTEGVPHPWLSPYGGLQRVLVIEEPALICQPPSPLSGGGREGEREGISIY